MQIARIGLDLAKYVFEIHGVDAHGKTVLRKTLRRHAVSTFFANLPSLAYRRCSNFSARR
jgi:transposase